MEFNSEWVKPMPGSRFYISLLGTISYVKQLGQAHIILLLNTSTQCRFLVKDTVYQYARAHLVGSKTRLSCPLLRDPER